MLSRLFRSACPFLIAALLFCAQGPASGTGIFVISDDDPVVSDTEEPTPIRRTLESPVPERPLTSEITPRADLADDNHDPASAAGSPVQAATAEAITLPCPEDGAEWLRGYLDQLIKKKISGFGSLDIDVTPMPGVMALSSCAFKRVAISGQSIEIKGLVISRLHIDVEDAIIDRSTTIKKERLRLLRNGIVKMSIEITENALNSFVKEKVKNKDALSDPKVELTEGEFSLSGRSKWWIVKSSFRVAGHFEVSDENLVLFVPHKLKLSGMSAPGFLRRKLMDKLNPVLDMSRFPFEIKLKTISIGENSMVISN